MAGDLPVAKGPAAESHWQPHDLTCQGPNLRRYEGATCNSTRTNLKGSHERHVVPNPGHLRARQWSVRAGWGSWQFDITNSVPVWCEKEHDRKPATFVRLELPHLRHYDTMVRGGKDSFAPYLQKLAAVNQHGPRLGRHHGPVAVRRAHLRRSWCAVGSVARGTRHLAG